VVYISKACLFHNITKLNEVTKQCVHVYEETTTSSGVLDIEAIVNEIRPKMKMEF